MELVGLVRIVRFKKAKALSPNALYTWGVTLLAQKRGSTVSYYHLDGNGSVRALSNSSKTITDTYSYNAFGELISSTGSTVNPFRWLGGAGIYDDGARGSVFGLMFAGDGTFSQSIGVIITSTLGAGTLFDACLASLCSGKNANDIKGLGKPVKAIIDFLLDKLKENLRIDPGSTEDCLKDARKAKPKTIVGRLIRAICSAAFGREDGVRVCFEIECVKFFKTGEFDDNACNACCDKTFAERNSPVYNQKCKDNCVPGAMSCRK